VAELLTHERAEVRREAATLCYRLASVAAPIVEALIAALASPDPIVRANAAATLGNVGPAASVAAERLEALLGDEDGDVREWAAFGLARIDPMRALRGGSTRARVATLQALGSSPSSLPVESIEVLLHLMKDSSEEVRIGAANVLGTALLYQETLFPKGTAGAEKIVLDAYTKEKSVAVRTQIVYALGRLPAVADTTVPWLIENLESSDPTLRAYTLGALRELSWKAAPRAASAVPAVLKALHHPDRDTRSGAAFALGYMARGAPEAVPALAQALMDSERVVRMHAAMALGTLGAASATPALIRAAQEFPDEPTREHVAWALAAFGAEAAEAIPTLREQLAAGGGVALAAACAVLAVAPEPPKAARDIVLSALLADEEGPRFVANNWLKRSGTCALLAELGAALDSPEPRRRERAASALGSIGPGASEALPRLKELRNDPDPAVREAADAALQLVEPDAPTREDRR
jgi:HEAT repeat protein